MRRVKRIALPAKVQVYLNRRQQVADERLAQGALNIEREWKNARQTKSMSAALHTLQKMMGDRQRCMYCVDSHGSDIEHFRPKAAYPGQTFNWSNMLLCCTECGRFKGNTFPMVQQSPLLVDPTVEDPWQHLDFDPDTGNLTARFDVHCNDWSTKGTKTVEVLHLDRREAMAVGYVNTYRRLSGIVQKALVPLAGGNMTAAELLSALLAADDHGLLGWCFNAAGQALMPFNALQAQHPQVWDECRSRVR